jgi:hypothetical protein
MSLPATSDGKSLVDEEEREFCCYNLSGSQNYPTPSLLLKSEYIEPPPPSNKSTLLQEKEEKYRKASLFCMQAFTPHKNCQFSKLIRWPIAFLGLFNCCYEEKVELL